MLNYFAAGPELIRWELLAIDEGGPYQLTMHHARGVIVEYFETMTDAMTRQRELEALLVAARTDGRVAPPTQIFH